MTMANEEHLKAQDALHEAVRDLCALSTDISEAVKVEAGVPPARDEDESDLATTLRGLVARAENVPAEEHALYAKFMSERGEAKDLNDPMFVGRYRYLNLVAELQLALAMSPPQAPTSDVDEHDDARSSARGCWATKSWRMVVVLLPNRRGRGTSSPKMRRTTQTGRMCRAELPGTPSGCSSTLGRISAAVGRHGA